MSHICVSCQKEFPSAEALNQHNLHKHSTAAKTRSSNLPLIIIIALVVLGGIIYIAYPSFNSSKYDLFAKCISDSGAMFYGAFWCPHCAEQKEMFGKSSKYLPYIECSTIDHHQFKVCEDAGITSYPTWVFPDKSQANVLTLVELSERTNCPLP